MVQRHIPALLCILLLLCTLLVGLSSCSTDDPITAGSIAPADVIRGCPVIFKQVYCTGDNNDTPVRYSYIELYNTADDPFSLEGIYLGYAKGDRDKFAPYALDPDAVIAPRSSYLIRCAQAVGEHGESYLDACEKFTLSHYDADMPNLRLSSKRCRLVLSSTPKAIEQSELLSEHVLAYFGAYNSSADTAFPFPYQSDSLNKHTAILRTDDNTAWTSVDYAKETCLTVTDCLPSSSQGQQCEFPLSAVQVTASVSGGRYASALAVTLSTLPGYDIVFSLDPAAAPAAFEAYSGDPVRISDTTSDTCGYTASLLMKKYGDRVKPSSEPTIGAVTLRACVTDGRDFGPIMTETYFVTEDIHTYDNILLLNITLDPADFTGKNGIYTVVTDDIFAPRGSCIGYMEIFDPMGSAPDDHYVALTMNGNGSLAFSQKSMRVSVRETCTPDSGGVLYYDLFSGTATDEAGAVIKAFDTFVLRNSGNDASFAHFRDALMHSLSSSVDACIQAYRPSLLFINGEFWGLYNLRERYSTDYFYRHYGLLPENLVMLESISPLLTNSWNTPYALNDGEAGDEDAFYEITDYIASHSMKEEEHFAWVEERMDLDNLTDFFIASCYLANTDWPGNNIKVWRNKDPNDPSGLDTRWRWVLSDMDFGIGHSTSADQQMFTHALTDGTVLGRLMVSLLENTTFRLRFADRACMLVNTIYDPDITCKQLSDFTDAIAPYIDLNFGRWPGDDGSMSRWEDQIDAADHFLSKRTKPFIREMQDALRVTVDSVSVADSTGADVYISSAFGTSGCERSNITSLYANGKTLYFRDSTTVSVHAVAQEGYRVTGISIRHGSRETVFEGDTAGIEVYARCEITPITEPITP